MSLKTILQDPLRIKKRQQALDKALDEAYRYKEAQYLTVGLNEEPETVKYLSLDAQESSNTSLKQTFKDLHEKALNLLHKGEECESVITSTLSPQIVSKAKESLLEGNLLTKDGRLVKIAALKELGLSFTSPIFLLHLTSLLLDNTQNQDEILTELKDLNKLMSKQQEEKEAESVALLEDYADRLNFYLNTKEPLSTSDLHAIDDMQRKLSLEILKCAKLVEKITLPKIKRYFRDLTEAKEATAFLDDYFYTTIERSIITAFLYVVSMMLAKSKLKLSYEPSWDLESKIITPITQILCFVHAQVLCRLQFLEKSIKLNPFDRDKVTELREAHEKAFLKVDLNFKRFLKFYRQKTTYILSFKLKSA